jgi:hypothetical protein
MTSISNTLDDPFDDSLHGLDKPIAFFAPKGFRCTILSHHRRDCRFIRSPNMEREAQFWICMGKANTSETDVDRNT